MQIKQTAAWPIGGAPTNYPSEPSWRTSVSQIPFIMSAPFPNF